MTWKFFEILAIPLAFGHINDKKKKNLKLSIKEKSLTVLTQGGTVGSAMALPKASLWCVTASGILSQIYIISTITFRKQTVNVLVFFSNALLVLSPHDNYYLEKQNLPWFLNNCLSFSWPYFTISRWPLIRINSKKIAKCIEQSSVSFKTAFTNL